MSIENLYAAVTRKDDINEIRLQNWGYWNQHNCYPDFEPAGWMDLLKLYIKTFHVSRAIAEQDAMLLADTISTMDMICRANTDPSATGVMRWGTEYALVLKMVYVEAYEKPAALLAEDVTRKLNVPCSRPTFFRRLKQAKHDLFVLAPSL
jgi:hypothetical protein